MKNFNVLSFQKSIYKTLRFLALLMALLASPAVVLGAETSNTLTKSILKASRTMLSNDPSWLLLLRQDPKAQRVIQSSDFFLTDQKDNHTVNSQAEQLAMIEALFADSMPVNEHVMCRFPARSQWLIERLGISEKELPDISCPALEFFTNSHPINQVSVVFIDEEVTSISNMMGHIGLKLSFRKELSDTPDKLVSFVTFIHTQNPITLLKNALVDGGKGEIQIDPWDEKRSYYLNVEKRSLWEHPLQIDEKQKHSLLLQLWELKNRDSVYAYLNYNCGTAIFDLLKSIDEDLNILANQHQQSRKKHWYSPLEYVQFLSQNDFLGPPVDILTDQDRFISKQRSSNLLDKSNSSQIRLALSSHRTPQKNKGASRSQSLDFGFTLGGSRIQDNHLADFSEYELKIIDLNGQFNFTNQSFELEKLGLYSMKHLPFYNSVKNDLSWQIDVGATRLPRHGTSNRSSHLAFGGKGGIGLNVSIGALDSLWLLFNGAYYYARMRQNNEISMHQMYLSSETGLARTIEWGNWVTKGLATFEYNHHINDSDLAYSTLLVGTNTSINHTNSVNLTHQRLSKNNFDLKSTYLQAEWVHYF